MITHDAIWAAIDEMADRMGLTRSGLAVAAGLDATTFNKCRESLNGVPHWPSFKSLARVLNLANMTLTEFAKIVESKEKKK